MVVGKVSLFRLQVYCLKIMGNARALFMTLSFSLIKSFKYSQKNIKSCVQRKHHQAHLRQPPEMRKKN